MSSSTGPERSTLMIDRRKAALALVLAALLAGGAFTILDQATHVGRLGRARGQSHDAPGAVENPQHAVRGAPYGLPLVSDAGRGFTPQTVGHDVAAEDTTMTVEGLVSIRELDSRLADGVQVRLLWDGGSGHVWVSVLDTCNGDRFKLPVAVGEQPLDVFHHPFAYAAHRGVDTDGTGARWARSQTPA